MSRPVLDLLPEIAARYGGAGTPLRMTAHLGPSELEVEVDRTEPRTRWTLRLQNPAFPDFTIHPRGFFDALRGAKCIDLGEEDFDAHFSLRGGDPDAVRRVWSRATMASMLDLFSTANLASKRQELVLTRPRVPGTVEDVVVGIELLRSLASPDVFGVAALRAMPEAVIEEDQALFPDGIRVGPLVIESQAITRAISTSSADVSWTFEAVDGWAAKADLERIPVEARDRVTSLGTARLSSIEGEAQIRWKTIETDPARLAAALAILRALARGPSLGAFR